MGAHLGLFIGVAAIVILLPGPDTAVVTKNVLMHGRDAALATSFGVCTGLAVWTLAAALGVASLVRASAVAFTTLKLVGALYLVWLGIQTLRAARHVAADHGPNNPGREPIGIRGGFRQGLFSDLANPKIAVFFTSLFPQFVSSGHAVLIPFLVLGAIFVVMTLAYLCVYSLIAARATETLQKPRVKAALDRITGTVLVAVGIRLALEHR